MFYKDSYLDNREEISLQEVLVYWFVNNKDMASKEQAIATVMV